jgi:hypothetical protein
MQDLPPRGRKGSGSNKAMWAVVVLLLLAALAFGGLYWYTNGDVASILDKIGSARTNGEPVARVNGTEITRDKLDAAKAQQTAVGLDEATANQQALDALIARELLLQQARADGVVATEQEVEQQLAQIKTQLGGEEQYQATLEQQVLTDQEVRVDLSEQIIIQKYLDSFIEANAVSATDEEIQSVYDQLAAAQEDAPSLEEARAQVEAFVIQQKQQQLVDQLIQQLRASANIEVLI